MTDAASAPATVPSAGRADPGWADPARGDPAWGDPPRATASSGAPVLATVGFEGPLDWLLELARAQKIDLARLSIAALIGSFADALEAALARPDGQALSLAAWGEWLVMAATLTQLRSRLLRPHEAPAAQAALTEAESWRRQLLGRAQLQAAADWLDRQPQLGRDVFVCGAPEQPRLRRGADITDLLRACLGLLRVPEHVAATAQPRPPPFWAVSQALAQIEQRLQECSNSAALTTFLPVVAAEAPDRERRCRAAVASTLLAGLELARSGTVALEQSAAWAPIHLQRREPGPGTPDHAGGPP